MTDQLDPSTIATAGILPAVACAMRKHSPVLEVVCVDLTVSVANET
jgi:hypothetical protein